MSYESGLIETKVKYPFERWHASEAHGLKLYTKENCNAAKAIFDDLIARLTGLGESASEEDKIAQFKIAVESLNDLDNEVGGWIETGEREDLCDLIYIITEKCGIDPKKYGGGEGPASEWRNW